MKRLDSIQGAVFTNKKKYAFTKSVFKTLKTIVIFIILFKKMN